MSSRPRLLPKIPSRRITATPMLTFMFRVVETVVALPDDILPASLEGVTLVGEALPNGCVGMVCAASPKELFWVIDEFVDPSSVELMPLPVGGGICLFDADTAVLPRRRTIREIADGGSLEVCSLEYSGAVGGQVSIQAAAAATWLATGADPSWHDVFDEFRAGSKAGGWFKPKWPARVYG